MNSHSGSFKNAYFNERQLCKTADECLITQDEWLSIRTEDVPRRYALSRNAVSYALAGLCLFCYSDQILSTFMFAPQMGLLAHFISMSPSLFK